MIDCPFCWAAVKEELMSKHVDWHFPQDLSENFGVIPDRHISDIPTGTQIDL